MSNTPKIIIVLALISLISGAVLALLDSYTGPKIEEYRKLQEKKAVAEVLPLNDRIKKVEQEDYVFYEAYRDSELVGVAFQVSGGGYQSELLLMLGLSPDLSQITGLKILSQLETPGLGTKIEKDESKKEEPDWFIQQFQGLQTGSPITYVKNVAPTGTSRVQAITGATVSSKAVVDILNTHIKKAKELRGIQ